MRCCVKRPPGCDSVARGAICRTRLSGGYPISMVGPRTGYVRLTGSCTDPFNYFRSFECPPCMGGFLSVELFNRINAIFRRMHCFGYLECCMTAAERMNKYDHDLRL